jgi:hypothetical protein
MNNVCRKKTDYETVLTEARPTYGCRATDDDDDSYEMGMRRNVAALVCFSY